MTPRRCIRFTLALCFSILLIFNTSYFWSPFQQSSDEVKIIKEKEHLSNSAVTVAASSRIKDSLKESGRVTDQLKVEPVHPNSEKEQPKEADVNLSTQDFAARRLSALNESLSFIIKDINTAQKIRNFEQFPPNDKNTYKHAFVVQVHNRDHYLAPLIHSLERVRGINQSLLIVSHDFYSKEVFDLIESIHFMPVLQVFYPLAMQLYRDKFPGPDPEDCPRNAKKPEAIKLKCVNAEHPDLYGHYREASYSQTKLHWFWKLHRVFEGLDVMKAFDGYVTLIEEDHYVTPDTLYILNMMIDAQGSLCSNCRILTLGNYDKKPSYQYTNEVVIVADFISSKHNMAMSFNRTVYNLIKQYSGDFCNYDDYNWDWSLQYIGKEKIPRNLPTMIVKTPRVHHIGECGVHHKSKKGVCDPALKIGPVDKLVESNRDKLFPASLKQGRPSAGTYIKAKKMKPNGGWGDVRDHELCTSFMND